MVCENDDERTVGLEVFDFGGHKLEVFGVSLGEGFYLKTGKRATDDCRVSRYVQSQKSGVLGGLVIAFGEPRKYAGGDAAVDGKMMIRSSR